MIPSRHSNTAACIYSEGQCTSTGYRHADPVPGRQRASTVIILGRANDCAFADFKK